MEFAIGADDTMTRDNDRHGVNGIGGSDRTIGMWAVDLLGDVSIRAYLTIRDCKDSLQSGLLKWRELCPINGDGEGCPFVV